MTYQTQTVTLNSGAASVTVRESIGLDQIDALALYPLLSYSRQSPRERQRASSFVDAFIRSQVVGDLGFEWPADERDTAKLQAAFEGWQALQNNDLVAWFNALDSINKVMLDPNASRPKAGRKPSAA